LPEAAHTALVHWPDVHTPLQQSPAFWQAAERAPHDEPPQSPCWHDWLQQSAYEVHVAPAARHAPPFPGFEDALNAPPSATQPPKLSVGSVVHPWSTTATRNAAPTTNDSLRTSMR
jgi:hypothetical protein